MAGEESFLSGIMHNPYVWIALILIGLAFFLNAVRHILQKRPMFKEKKSKEIIAEEMKHKMKIKGIKCNADITLDIAPLGRVEKWYHDVGEQKDLILDENSKRYLPPDKVPDDCKHDYDIYIFKVWRTNALFRFLKIGYNTYILVDRKYLELGSNNKYGSSWTLHPKTHFERFAGVFVTSEETLAYIYNLTMNYFGESTLDHMVNSSNRVIYHDLAHAKGIDRLEKKEKIKREGYERSKRARIDEEAESETD